MGTVELKQFVSLSCSMFASMRLVALPQSGKGPEANVSTSNQQYLTPEIGDFAAAQLH